MQGNTRQPDIAEASYHMCGDESASGVALEVVSAAFRNLCCFLNADSATDLAINSCSWSFSFEFS